MTNELSFYDVSVILFFIAGLGTIIVAFMWAVAKVSEICGLVEMQDKNGGEQE